jgi:hypothetical protein
MTSAWVGSLCETPPQGKPGMTDRALTALVAAWKTTTIATSLFVAAVALSRVWDSAIYLQGLQRALRLEM